MRSYCELLVKTCHRRGAHAMGGMAAFIPSRRDAEVNAIALEKVREDKDREASQGFDGTWVAHPDLVPVALESFDRVLGERPNQIDRRRHDVEIRSADLLDVASTPGDVTEEGPRATSPSGSSTSQRGSTVGGRRDRQPDGGRGHRGDLALADLAMAAARPRHRGRRGGSRTRRWRSSARATRRHGRCSSASPLQPDYVEFLTLPAYDRLLADERVGATSG